MLAAMLRPTCWRVVSACSTPTRRSNSDQSTKSRTGWRPNHPATGRQAAQRHGLGGHHVEARADGRRSGEHTFEGLGDVVGMDVVQHAEPQIGQGERFTDGQPPPDVEIQIARRRDDRPRTADVPGVEHHTRHSAGERLAVQQHLDRGFADPIVAVGSPRLCFGDWHPGGGTVDPDGAAVDQQRPSGPQRLDELLRRLRREAQQVDNGIPGQRGDPLAEFPSAVLGVAINGDLLDRVPLRGRHVRIAGAAAERYDVMASPYQTRDEVAPDMASGADHDNAADRPSVTNTSGRR